MPHKLMPIIAAMMAGGLALPTLAAEREDVRKVINLVAAVRMPFPEDLPRNRAKTDRVWLEGVGTTTGCIIVDERRWCYEHIPSEGSRAEMLRIRNEPSRGLAVGAVYTYMVDFDVEGHVDVGSTAEVDQLDGQRRTQIAEVIKFYHRGTNRGDQAEYQRMYDEGIQIALRYFGE